MKDRFGWFSVLVILAFLSSSVSSCNHNSSYGIIKPLETQICQKQSGKSCQQPYWKKYYNTELARR